MTAMPRSPLHIGCASGFSGDRSDGAPAVVRIAGQYARRRHADLRDAGRTHWRWRNWRATRIRALATSRCWMIWSGPVGRLPAPRHRYRQHFGAANLRAARRIAELAARQGSAAPRIAVVHGDALDAPEQRDLLRQRLGGALDGLTWSARRLPARPRSPRRWSRARADRGRRPRGGSFVDAGTGAGHYSAGTRPIGPVWDAPPSPATCWNAACRSRAATSACRA